MHDYHLRRQCHSHYARSQNNDLPRASLPSLMLFLGRSECSCANLHALSGLPNAAAHRAQQKRSPKGSLAADLRKADFILFADGGGPLPLKSLRGDLLQSHGNRLL